MCGRYALFRWNREFAGLPGFPPDQQAQWNISPAQWVLMLRADEQGNRSLARARWGLTPAWLTDLSRTPAHARAETLAEQPMFRDAFRQRRCLLPANGFYEWRGNARKQPFWLTPGEGSSLFFAGLWESYPVQEQNWLSVAVVTQAVLTQRRPLILDEEGQRLWLDPQTPEHVLQGLLASRQMQLRERPLANLINDPTLDGPACLTPA
ncbi:SOS response-associated peptidase [Pseudomonas sp. DTU_2021_1001937_2_SI_NGA_ILE_001]|uniref:SOS response-associated peptidase n=1 Tax=Pseudomonas sp. DTU_2021_1001937_2_SI_NGA_ILE_001 TaxID=3077589 RepID=UPI0028FC1A52|nr:SOS response-associated peptidase [Pseudomonas sp. DTU_2021_1001937_2_SI_NGA_ILE_001]WNW13476.1 SOS response-associated peptidase [Pseudomonas sp. DTU_2021_1001937_2_SI_NGA_ILE_001]